MAFLDQLTFWNCLFEDKVDLSQTITKHTLQQDTDCASRYYTSTVPLFDQDPCDPSTVCSRNLQSSRCLISHQLYFKDRLKSPEFLQKLFDFWTAKSINDFIICYISQSTNCQVSPNTYESQRGSWPICPPLLQKQNACLIG